MQDTIEFLKTKIFDITSIPKKYFDNHNFSYPQNLNSNITFEIKDIDMTPTQRFINEWAKLNNKTTDTINSPFDVYFKVCPKRLPRKMKKKYKSGNLFLVNKINKKYPGYLYKNCILTNGNNIDNNDNNDNQLSYTIKMDYTEQLN